MHYKAPDNSVHFLDDDSFAHLLSEDCVQISDEEAEAIRLSQIVPPTHNELILAQIAQLEATITNRRIREAALTDAGKTWLEGIDAQITALRGQLV